MTMHNVKKTMQALLFRLYLFLSSYFMRVENGAEGHLVDSAVDGKPKRVYHPRRAFTTRAQLRAHLAEKRAANREHHALIMSELMGIARVVIEDGIVALFSTMDEGYITARITYTPERFAGRIPPTIEAGDIMREIVRELEEAGYRVGWYDRAYKRETEEHELVGLNVISIFIHDIDDAEDDVQPAEEDEPAPERKLLTGPPERKLLTA